MYAYAEKNGIFTNCMYYELLPAFMCKMILSRLGYLTT